ncbi:nuclear hormone receptor E75-like [Babylonia areolata]|uniref:nuclear hormone receptor E75-like n=1 Tax=Babylonia areolata TaxID=304850 RepID=UPI003FD06122
MAGELQKLIQNCNGAFHSDLMKMFVAKHRSDSSSSSNNAKPQPAGIHPGNNKTSGASIFNTTTTTNTTNTTTSIDTTDNANILMQKTLTDNHHNLNNKTDTTNTTDTPTITTDNKTATLTLNGGASPQVDNQNVNANLNQVGSKPAACPEVPDPNANLSEVNAVLQEVRGALSESRQQLVQQVTEAAVDAHLTTCINTQQAVAEARTRFMAMKASGQLPDMSKLSLSAGSMWEKMMDQMMPEMTKTMNFFKMLPGFSELRPEDQMKLIKAGSFEVMMTRFAMLIDHEKDTMLDPSHKMVVPRHVVKAMPMGGFLDGFFHVGAQFNPVGLTDGEIALFTAVLVFSPSRPGLGDARLVSGLQSLYQQALFCLLKENHSDPEAKLTKVLSLVPMFRRINEEHSKALGAMKMQSPDAFSKQFPPVHKELYSGDNQ